MAAIPVRTFATLVGNFAAGVQGRARDLVDFSTGSVLRAVAEATADLVLWLQSIIVYVLTLTRARTSQGADLDSWMADWSFFRLPAIGTTGLVTFARFSADDGAIIPVGAEVATGDGTRVYRVYRVPTDPAWNEAAGGYALPAGVVSLDVPVEAVMPEGEATATAWNVSAGQVNTMRSSVDGVDTVLNAAPFITGIDAESDDAFRDRFPDYIAGLSKATRAAIRSAVRGVRQGLQLTIDEQPGFVTVVVDDGSGAPADALVLRCLDAVVGENGVRAAGVRIGVVGAQRLTATVMMTIVVAPAYVSQDVVARVTDAVGAYIAGLGLGVRLPYTALAHVAYGVPGVVNVSSVQVNGTNLDLIPTLGQTVKPGDLIISASAST